jgi:ppGpp synthetase/RelA/SpoT-type nucleotidyltranferase
VAERTVEDRLREEYFDLLPGIRRVAEELEAEIRYCLLPISLELDRYERLVVSSRIKECESAVDALRRRQEGATFDRDQPQLYVLTSLKDLAGVRVSVFPRKRWNEIDLEVRRRFASWEPDPVLDENGHLLAAKYYGYCKPATRFGVSSRFFRC